MQSYPLTFGVWKPRGINNYIKCVYNIYLYGLYINIKYINIEREIDIHHRNLNNR